MEMYTEAYKRYSEKCQTFGVRQLEFIDFIQSLTFEQIEMMLGDFH